MFAEDVPGTASGHGSAAVLRPMLSSFRFVDGNRPLYRALVGKRGNDLIVGSARDMLSDVLTEHLHAQLTELDEHQLDVAAAFLVSAMMGLLTWWLDTEAPSSADEMYACFERLATQGIEPLLGVSHSCQGR